MAKKLFTVKTLIEDSAGFTSPAIFEFRFDSETERLLGIFPLKGKCRIKPYILLDILIQLIPEKYGDATKVKFVHNDNEFGSHPALKVGGKTKTYSLDYCMDIEWMYNPHIMDLVAYWRRFRPCFESMYDIPIQKILFWDEDLNYCKNDNIEC